VPRRGEYKGGFPAVSPKVPEPTRIGPRQVTGLDAQGRPSAVVFNPADHACSTLAGELADEWVELAAASTLGLASCRGYRTAIRSFCAHVDATLDQPHSASLARPVPDLHQAVTEWIRILPASFPAGSTQPYVFARQLRMLVSRRAAHPERDVAGHLHRWVQGSVGLRRPRSEEVDEFTRADKKKLIQTAWTDRFAVEARIKTGWELATSGCDPNLGGWDEPRNLLWALSRSTVTCQDIDRRLPVVAQWPPALRALVPEGVLAWHARGYLLRQLVRMLYPSDMDLHSYRILLMAATGRAPEEVVMLTEDDLEFGPDSVLIDFTKNRARTVQRRSYAIEPSKDHRVLHPGTAAPRPPAGRPRRHRARPAVPARGRRPSPLRADGAGVRRQWARHPVPRMAPAPPGRHRWPLRHPPAAQVRQGREGHRLQGPHQRYRRRPHR
jgi:hypothetical protein